MLPSCRLQLFGLTLIAGVVCTAIVGDLFAQDKRPAESVTELQAPKATGLGDTASEQAWRKAAGLIKRYCLDCHSGAEPQAGLNLGVMENSRSRSEHWRASMAQHASDWEAIAKKLLVRQMPPGESARPSESEYRFLLDWLGPELDAVAAAKPNPGRTPSMRRLTRDEYQNAIRDLLDLTIDAERLLPADESSHGFDNITVGEFSTTLLTRYVAAAQKISRLAIGRQTDESPRGETIRIRPDRTQEERSEGLPPGTRGGLLIPHTFPRAGQFEIRIRLARDRNEEVEGLRGLHLLEVSLDRKRSKLFEIRPPKNKDHTQVDAHLVCRIDVPAGPHTLGVTFIDQPRLLVETKRQPYQAHFNRHRHPRLTPAIYQVSINGPFGPRQTASSPSRLRIFGNRSESTGASSARDKRERAEQILARLATRAYRRPATEQDLEKCMAFFAQGQQRAGFDAGIELALSSILVNPNFLFRVEKDPPNAMTGQPYQISDWELASRLSFFLWSSIPDKELLTLAEEKQLHRPAVLAQQVERMLRDRRSDTLATRFASQWLQLRSLQAVTPDARKFPDFDDNLRQAMRRESELFFNNVLRENASVLQLLQADYTFLNERLAKHYGVPHVYGSRFRRVTLPQESHRGGLLRQGGVLTVTSYATRTSPVLRGHWVLKNLLGAAPPPPPANVPALNESRVAAALPIRERLQAHRVNAACAHCHEAMDPIGFALENYDAVGRWRETVDGQTIDTNSTIPRREPFRGVVGLERELLKQPDAFAAAFTEKLLTYAIGRGLEFYDASAVRRIVKEAKKDDLRMKSIVLGVVMSRPFRMRITPSTMEAPRHSKQ